MNRADELHGQLSNERSDLSNQPKARTMSQTKHHRANTATATMPAAGAALAAT
ncbi:MAG: hypothetical protein GDYSWBUE_001799 [Candidatus Fervidibacterota bacterium]